MLEPKVWWVSSWSRLRDSSKLPTMSWEWLIVVSGYVSSEGISVEKDSTWNHSRIMVKSFWTMSLCLQKLESFWKGNKFSLNLTLAEI